MSEKYDSEVIVKELKEVRDAFLSLSKGDDYLSFQDLINCRGLMMQIDEGDLKLSDIECVWVQVVANSELSKSVESNEPWGINSSLNFNQFLEFLSQCELCSMRQEDSKSVRNAQNLVDKIVLVKRCLFEYLRATILNEFRVISSETVDDDDNDDGAKRLHLDTIKATIERGLYRRGSLDNSYLQSNLRINESRLITDANMLEKARAIQSLDLSLRRSSLKSQLNDRPSYSFLKEHGIYKAGGLDARIFEQKLLKTMLKRQLENPERPSHEKLKEKGIILSNQNLEHKLAAKIVNTCLQSRPTMGGLVDLGIVNEKHIVSLEDPEEQKRTADKRRQLIIKNQVESLLKKREPIEAIANQGILMNVTPQEKSVEKAFLTHKLANALANRPNPSEIKDKVYLGENFDGSVSNSLWHKRITEVHKEVHKALLQSSSVNALDEKTVEGEEKVVEQELEKRKSLLAKELNARAPLDELKNQGIYMDDTAVRSHHLERLLLQNTVAHKLNSPSRPSIVQLSNQGVMVGVDQLGNSITSMNIMVAARQVKHDLENRHSLADLKAKGLYVDSKQDKDIEFIHQQLDLEHNLIAAQLTKLLSQNRAEGSSAHIEESDVLALAYQELLTLPDSSSIDVSSLLGWKVLEGCFDSSVISEYFEQCDGDNDGSITFSEFLLFVDMCAKHLTQKMEGGLREEDYYQFFVPIDGTHLISFDSAKNIKIVSNWAWCAGFDEIKLKEIFGSTECSDSSQSYQNKEGFMHFCEVCEAAAKKANQKFDLGDDRLILKEALVQKLKNRPEFDELKEKNIVLGVSPAAALLERNLIANSIKQQLARRPDMEELERQGIILPENIAKKHASSRRSLSVQIERQALSFNAKQKSESSYGAKYTVLLRDVLDVYASLKVPTSVLIKSSAC
mmetsp:Transcript_4867/g.7367  ORF Transcript_4867/g.7367 Transcript_4867/m.7367 type:complete len:906 (-) Transcript_4867:87-2804(-)